MSIAGLLDQIRALRQREVAYTISYDYLAMEQLQVQRRQQRQWQRQQSERCPYCCHHSDDGNQPGTDHHRRITMVQQMVQECADLVTDPAIAQCRDRRHHDQRQQQQREWQQVHPAARGRREVTVRDNNNNNMKKPDTKPDELKSPSAVYCASSSSHIIQHCASSSCRGGCCSGSCAAGMDNADAQSNTNQSSSSSMAYWRREMFVWACRVADTFDIDRGIVVSSFRVLDCYVARKLLQQRHQQRRRRGQAYDDTEESSSSSARTPGATIMMMTMITRDDFQLYSVTCLYLQVKILSCTTSTSTSSRMSSGKLGIQSLVEMSRGQYSRAEIAAAERDILTTMDWHVNPPTAIQYANLYWDILLFDDGCSGYDDDAAVATMKAAAAALVEMATAEGSFVSCSPGLVGLAAVLIAVRLVANNNNCRADEESIQRLLGQLLEGTTTTAVIDNANDKKELERIYLQLQRLDC